MPAKLISDIELAGIRLDADEQLFVDTGRVLREDQATRTVTAVTMVLTSDYDTIYDGEASIYPISARRDRFDEVGGALIFIRQYRVVLPSAALSVNIQVGDFWITDTSDDPGVVARMMEVKDVLPGSISGYRRLTVQDHKQ